MLEDKKYIDADIVKLRQMYVEEKVNLVSNYVYLENGIWEISERSFLKGRFFIACPENFTDIREAIFEGNNQMGGRRPFSILRSLHKSMVISLYEVTGMTATDINISDNFEELFPGYSIDEKGMVEADACVVKWFDYRQTDKGVPYYHQIFSACEGKCMVIGHMHTYMNEYDRCRNLMKRLLGTIRFCDKECDTDAGSNDLCGTF